MSGSPFQWPMKQVCIKHPCTQDLSSSPTGLYTPVYFFVQIFRDAVRYQFTHEILSEDESVWKGQVVPRDRRVSWILRCQPSCHEG